MGTAKIAFKIGEIDFSCEGEDKWVSSQLESVLGKVPALIKIAGNDQPRSENRGNGSEEKEANGANKNGESLTLAKHL